MSEEQLKSLLPQTVSHSTCGVSAKRAAERCVDATPGKHQSTTSDIDGQTNGDFSCTTVRAADLTAEGLRSAGTEWSAQCPCMGSDHCRQRDARRNRRSVTVSKKARFEALNWYDFCLTKVTKSVNLKEDIGDRQLLPRVKKSHEILTYVTPSELCVRCVNKLEG